MKFLWCDTETLGINPVSSFPFQVGMIFENRLDGDSENYYKEFQFDPFDIPYAVLEEESTLAHGFSESEIRSFPIKSREAVNRLKNSLDNMVKFGDGSKPYFVAYNTFFDFKQMQRLFSYHGVNINLYFENMLDVYKQAKLARERGVLPTEMFNHYVDKDGIDKYSIKLIDLAKHLNVEHTDAHNALSDIKATQAISLYLESKGVSILDTAWKKFF